jgi:isopentenyl diphosphate isomerase/L-lactate dehydrogenase-like FMN-dependent dehydrogenase
MEPRYKVIPENTKGNSDSITRAYLDALVLEQRLIGSVTPDLTTQFLGQTLSTPIMTAAMSGLTRLTENGHRKLAEAVKQVDSVMWMGISEDSEVEDVTATGVRTIEIIKPYASHEQFKAKIAHAKACGCMAVGMDIDHCFAPDGSYGTDRPGNPLHSKTVADLADYVAACEGTPFIVKGVLSVADACACVEAGVSAIVLSHHHNIYPFAIPPLMVLPDIRRAVGRDVTIVVDSLLKDGYDCCKALALGADAVCVGRALQKPLVQGGSEGTAAYLKEMTDQLRGIMGRVGAPSVDALSPDVVHLLPIR